MLAKYNWITLKTFLWFSTELNTKANCLAEPTVSLCHYTSCSLSSSYTVLFSISKKKKLTLPQSPAHNHTLTLSIILQSLSEIVSCRFNLMCVSSVRPTLSSHVKGILLFTLPIAHYFPLYRLPNFWILYLLICFLIGSLSPLWTLAVKQQGQQCFISYVAVDCV